MLIYNLIFMAIQWKKDMELGIEIIDKQHQYFVGLMNELYETNYNLKLKDTLGDIIKQLVAYKEFHFATEEKYFDKFNYENSVEHKNKHAELSRKVEEFKKRYEQEGSKIIGELLDFLENWLVEHLEIQDKKYVQCFRNNGLK